MNTQVIKNFIKNPPRLLKPVINKPVDWANYYIDKPDSFLQNTAAFSYAFGSVGLIAGLLINKEVPEKEKRFMITQEAVEGCLDIGSIILVSEKFKQWGEKLVKKGLFIPSIDKLSEKEIKSHIKTFFKTPEKLAPQIESKIKTHLKCTKLATSTIGILVAFNIISPLIRNKIASKIDKFFHEKENKTNKLPTVERQIFSNINSEVFDTFKTRLNTYS